MTRAVGYVRVSDEEQVDGLSLDAQRRQLELYCERHGFDLVHVYVDEGVSAHTDKLSKRPQFAAMLEAIDRHEADIVVVDTIDRFARHSGLQRQAVERIGRANAGFASIKEQFDYTTPSGKLMLNMLGAVNEFQSDMIGVHVKKSKQEAFDRGLPTGGLPFGYRGETGETAGARAELDPVAAAAVLETFTLRDQGMSQSALARRLNEAGFRTQRGNAFTSWAIKDMLSCRFYIGLVTLAGDERQGAHVPIVDRALFERVQLRKQQRNVARREAWVTMGALTGRVRCGTCQRPVWADRDRMGRPMYREHHGHDCKSNGRSIAAHFLDDEIGAVFGALQVDEVLLAEAAAAVRSATLDVVEVESLQRSRRRLARAYADGGIEDLEYEARLGAIDEKLRAATLAPTTAPDLEAAAALLRDLPTLWGKATVSERRELLGALVEEVHIDISERRIVGIVALAAFDDLLNAAVIHRAESRSGEFGCGGDGGVLTLRSTDHEGEASADEPPARYWAIERGVAA